MYLSREVIERALLDHEVMAPGDLLLVSSDSGVRKRDGRLFEHLVDITGLPADRIGHTGDDRTSDVAVAKSLGLRAAWSRATDLNRYESRVLKAEGSHLTGSLIAGCSRATRVSKQGGSRELEVIREVSASVAAPLLTGFVLWSLLEAQERGLNTLYFLARDGQVLTKIAEALVRRFGITVEPRYLYASRQALFLPALDPEDTCFEDVCLRMVVGRTIPDVARSLEMSEDALLLALPPELTPERMGRRSFDDDRARQFVRFLRESKLRAHVASLAEQRRLGMRSYFTSQGMAESGTIGLVDVGWKGTLQFFMANALKLAIPHSPPRITGFYFGLGRVPPPLAGEVHVFLGDGMSFSASLIELFCAADHGSTWAYSEHEPGYVLQSEVNDAACEWGLAAQQEAIVEFAERLADVASGARLDLRELCETLQSTSIAAFTNFRRNPTRDEAEVYGPFQHSPDAAHDRFAELGPRSSLVGALASLFPMLRGRLPFIRRRKVLWPQATFMRSWSQTGLHQLAGGVLLLRSGLARFRRH
jgi:hypothetical protein